MLCPGWIVPFLSEKCLSVLCSRFCPESVLSGVSGAAPALSGYHLLGVSSSGPPLGATSIFGAQMGLSKAACSWSWVSVCELSCYVRGPLAHGTFSCLHVGVTGAWDALRPFCLVLRSLRVSSLLSSLVSICCFRLVVSYEAFLRFLFFNVRVPALGVCFVVTVGLV